LEVILVALNPKKRLSVDEGVLIVSSPIHHQYTSFGENWQRSERPLLC
jgi:hypothetical protein